MRNVHYDAAPCFADVGSHRGGGALQIGPTAFSGAHRRFERNEEIFGQGEPVDYVYRVMSGAVRTVRFTSEGRRHIAAFHFPGDIFGMDFAPVHSFAAEAVGEACIIMVRRSLVDKAIADNPEAARAWLALAANQMRDAQEHAVVLGLKGAGERLAAFLIRLADRLADHTQLDLPMSRADIADHLALTIETVSRAFTQMEREQAIALPRSRHVVLRDRSALELLQAA
jgi:CRP/FNR family nitrogen fixation transcriptional regulator